jgi:hypothetical protein
MFETLAFVISLPAFGLACALWAIVGYQSARRKGYRAPGAATVLLVGACTGVASTVIRNPRNSTTYRFFVDFFWLALFWAVAATAIVLLLLPRKQVRTFGSRRPRFPFVRAGQLLIAAAWIVFALTVAWRIGGTIDSTAFTKGLLLTFGFLVPTGRYLVRMGRRAEAEASSDAYAVEAVDHPVLYLRAFNRERQFFAIGTAAEYGTLAKGWHSNVSQPQQNVGATFEECFADAVNRPLGPLVALGSPEDYVAPAGAARLYAKDSDWMQHVDRLMRKARCMLVEVGASANLRWEFEHIRKEGLHDKLFVITRPSTEGKWLSWAFWRLVWRIQGIPTVSVRQFAATLAPLGYDFGTLDPGPGSVVAFDADGKAMMLTTGAAWPGEFVKPICDWILERRLSGRYVSIACSRCGRRMYAFANDVDTPSQCPNCRYGASWKRMWKRSAHIVYVLVWFLGILASLTLIVWIVPEGSVFDRHIGWILIPAFVLSFAVLVRVLGRMEDPPPLREPDTGASTDTHDKDARRSQKVRRRRR